MSWVAWLDRMMGTTPKEAAHTAADDEQIAQRVQTLTQLEAVRRDVLELDARVAVTEEMLRNKSWLFDEGPPK